MGDEIGRHHGAGPRPAYAATEEAAAASAKQREVIEAIRKCGGAARVTEIARAVAAHPNTVRGHLDGLIDAGVVTAEAQETPYRGRPWLKYSIRSPQPSELANEYVQLIQVLAGQLCGSESTDGSAAITRAEELGRVWGRGVLPSDRPREATWMEYEDPLGAAVQELRKLGFDPHLRENKIVGLRACPFINADGAAPDAMICHIHEGYIRERAGECSVDLVPFDRRGECGVVVKLP